MKFIKFINWVYVIGVLLDLVLLPLFLILAIVKLCDATAMPWVGVCVPLIIVIALSPAMLIAKYIIDLRGKQQNGER